MPMNRDLNEEEGGGFTVDTRAGALLAAEAAENKKGERIVILDMREVTLIADYFVIISARSVVHAESIADAVSEVLEEQGWSRLNRAAGSRSHWVLMDYGGVVVHILTEEERQYYNLERLWGDAGVVDRARVAAQSKSSL